MAIFRGVGGSGDSSDNSFLQEVTGQANAASASASASSASASASSASAIAASTSASNASNSADDAETAKLIAQSSVSTALAQAIIATTQAGIATTKASEAAASATSAQNLEITSASFDTADGTLTLTKANSGTVTTDLDGRYADLSGATFTGDLRIESTLPRLYLTDTNNNSDYSIINTDGKFSIYDDSAGVYRTVIDSSGNVGIGTTSPTATLDVNGELAIRGGEGVDDARMYFRASDNSNRFTIETDLDGITSNDILGFRSTSADNILTLKGNGNVGIGTSSPNYETHIHETTADADARIQLTNADTGTGTGDGFHIIMNGTTAGKQVNLLNREASPLAFWTSNTERMRIDSSGNLLVGRTSTLNSAQTSIKGASGKQVLTLQTTTDSNSFIQGYNSSTALAFQVRGDGDVYISGDLGIGTTSPATKLAVHGGTSGTDVDVASFNSVSGALNIRCSDLAAANPTWTLRSFSGEPIAFAQATDERMRIDSSGNVGIGTDTPAQALDVVGNIAVSGTVDGVDIDSLNTTVAGKANLSGATFTGNVNIGIPPSGTQSLTVAGTTNLYGGVTGDLDVTGTVTAPNVDISTTGSVTTNIATGSDNNNNTDVKVVNIGTGYGGSSGSGDSTTINMGSQDIFAKNIFNMGNGVTTANGSTINLKGTVNVDGNLDVDGKIIGSTEGVVLEHNKSADLEPVLELQNTTAQGNGYRGAFISMTGYNTSGTEYTRGVIGMGNSTAQYSFPYIAANITSVSCGIKLSGSTGTTYNALTPCNSIGTSLNNGMQCGHPFYKWNTVYATNGNIATSDQTHKRDVEELSEAETRVAIACKGLLRKYRWKDAYEEKGEEARIHFGIMAQDLRDAFSAEELDASRYAMFCSDTWWEDETGERHEEQELAPEGAVETTQLGVRYDELLAFIIAAI